MGLGLNLGALPMNPALVAAALNQAGWGLINNLQNQPEPNFNQGGSGGASGFANGPSNNSRKYLWKPFAQRILFIKNRIFTKSFLK